MIDPEYTIPKEVFEEQKRKDAFEEAMNNLKFDIKT